MADTILGCQPVTGSLRLEARGGNFCAVCGLIPPIPKWLRWIRCPIRLGWHPQFQVQPGQSSVENHVDRRRFLDKFQLIKFGSPVHGHVLFQGRQLVLIEPHELRAGQPAVAARQQRLVHRRQERGAGQHLTVKTPVPQPVTGCGASCRQVQSQFTGGRQLERELRTLRRAAHLDLGFLAEPDLGMIRQCIKEGVEFCSGEQPEAGTVAVVDSLHDGEELVIGFADDIRGRGLARNHIERLEQLTGHPPFENNPEFAPRPSPGQIQRQKNHQFQRLAVRLRVDCSGIGCERWRRRFRLAAGPAVQPYHCRWRQRREHQCHDMGADCAIDTRGPAGT